MLSMIFVSLTNFNAFSLSLSCNETNDNARVFASIAYKVFLIYFELLVLYPSYSPLVQWFAMYQRKQHIVLRSVLVDSAIVSLKTQGWAPRSVPFRTFRSFPFFFQVFGDL